MACTMPGFPDKYMPFMDEDRWGSMASSRKFTIGPIVRGFEGGTSARSSTWSPVAPAGKSS